MASVVAEFAIPVELQLKDGPRERLTAHIMRVNTGFFVLSSPAALDPTRTLEVFYLKRAIFCETTYCHPQDDGSYRVGAKILDPTDGALRAEKRIRLDTFAELSTPKMASATAVRIIDMSSSGLGVKLSSPLAVGSLAYVELEHGVAFGEIRHCTKIEDGYRAGLFVDEFIQREVAFGPHRSGIVRGTKPSSLAHALRSALLPKKSF